MPAESHSEDIWPAAYLFRSGIDDGVPSRERCHFDSRNGG